VVLPVQGSLTGRVVTTGEPVISNAAEEEAGAHVRTVQLAAIRETLIVPLRTARGIVGTLGVMNRPSGFGREDARILQRLADQVAVAIVNARLFADIQESTREWQSTFDAIGVGMAVVNDEGRVLRCNARARQLAGDETTFAMLGRPFYKAVLGVAVPSGDDPLQAAIREGTRMRARCTHADGSRVYDIVAVPHLDSGAVVTFDLVPAPHG
jgi:PAS domain-containing protein